MLDFYIKITFFPVQCVINQAANDTKIKLVEYMWYRVDVLSPERDTYESSYYAVVLPRFYV